MIYRSDNPALDFHHQLNTLKASSLGEDGRHFLVLIESFKHNKFGSGLKECLTNTVGP